MPDAFAVPAATTATVADSTEALLTEATRLVRDELPGLAFLPERRYDRDTFPTIGQYDWLAGQVLYAVVRAVKPAVVVEVSTSSGYSTTFMALAVARNGTGRVHSVDLDADAQRAAGRWLRAQGIDHVVELHTGDCRELVPRLVDRGVDLLFVDSLHSFGIAEWYLRDVIPRLAPDAVVHIHDVMPPEARVRIHGGPPYRPEPLPPVPRPSFLLKRAVWLLLHGRVPNPLPRRPPREMLPLERLEVFPPSVPDSLPTIDGNYFEEAVLVRELLRDVPREEAVYLHTLAPRLAVCEPQRYAERDRIQRTDALGRPLEWNDALWCRARTLQRVAPPERVRPLVRELRRRYYGPRGRPAPGQT